MATSKTIRSSQYCVSAGEFTSTYIHYDVPWEIGHTHELAGLKSGQPQIEFAMDMHNNNVGLEIGQKLGQGAEDDKIHDACDEAHKDGRLIFIKDGKLIKPATYKVKVRYEITRQPYQIIIKPIYETVTTDKLGKPKN